MFESRWNLMLPTITNGIITRQTSSNFHDTSPSTTTEKTSSNELLTNMSSPCCTSSAMASTSDVMRLTITPAFSRS